MDVRGGERLAQPLARLVLEEAHSFGAELLRQLLQLTAPRAEADDRHSEIVQIAKVRRRDDQRVEVLGMADVARVHDYEPAVEPGRARPFVALRTRRDRGGVDPVRDHDDALGRGSLGDQPLAHPFPDRHDRVRTPEVEADERAERPDDERVRQPPQLGRDLGEDVLADHEQGDVPAPCDQQAEVADDRGIGHAEHEVWRR